MYLTRDDYSGGAGMLKTKNIAVLGVFMGILSLLLGSCSSLRALKEYAFEEKIKYGENVIVSFGGGGNSGIILLKNMVVIIDTKKEGSEKAFFNSIQNLVADKKVFIINTHLHHDHTAGNYLFGAERIYIPNYSDELWNRYVLDQNTTKRLAYTKVGEQCSIRDGDDIIDIIPIGGGHTDKDLVVYYRNKNMLFVGDLLYKRYHPFLDKSAGANADEWIASLARLINMFSPDYVVPGHGPMSAENDLVEYKQYFIDIKEAIGDEDALAKIKAKYSHYDELPKKTSFANVVTYIEDTP